MITELDGPSFAKFTGEAEVLDMNGVVELADTDGIDFDDGAQILYLQLSFKLFY